MWRPPHNMLQSHAFAVRPNSRRFAYKLEPMTVEQFAMPQCAVTLRGSCKHAKARLVTEQAHDRPSLPSRLWAPHFGAIMVVDTSITWNMDMAWTDI